MFLGNASLVTGAILTGLAQNMGMFLGGRFLTGLGCTMAAIASKTYMAEITSPKTRGFWLGLLNVRHRVLIRSQSPE
jgi:MFS family permease